MKRLIYLILILLSCCFTACRSIKYVPVETVRTEYKTRDSVRYDSIYHRDSIYTLIKGDSVYLYKYKYLYRYLIINKVDTVLKTDSVQEAYPVEKKLSRYQSLKMELGGWAFGIVIAFVLWIGGRFVYRLIKKMR